MWCALPHNGEEAVGTGAYRDILLSGNEALVSKACQCPFGGDVLGFADHAIAMTVRFDPIDLGGDAEDGGLTPRTLVVFDYAQAFTLYPT